MDTIRFFRAITTGGRDFSEDRRAWADSLTADDIRTGIEDLRAAGRLHGDPPGPSR